jgi:hypothetical protein
MNKRTSLRDDSLAALCLIKYSVDKVRYELAAGTSAEFKKCIVEPILIDISYQCGQLKDAIFELTDLAAD